jgi:hypothetical protein
MTAPADISALIDRLTEMASEGRRFPIGGRIMIDEQELFETLDLMRLALPNEISQARRVVQDRQQVILDAQAEAEKIVSIARERAAYMISDRGLMAEARARGEDAMRMSREQTRKTLSEIDAYALKIFERVEQAMREGLNEMEQAKGQIGQTAHTP